MTHAAMRKLVGRLPLRIRRVKWTDPTLTVAGDGWALSLTCPWRVCSRSPEGIVFGWSVPDVEDRAWDLVGIDIVGVGPQATESFADPVFELSNGARLEVFSDTEVDPWVLHAGDFTIVGPLTAEDWT